MNQVLNQGTLVLATKEHPRRNHSVMGPVHGWGETGRIVKQTQIRQDVYSVTFVSLNRCNLMTSEFVIIDENIAELLHESKYSELLKCALIASRSAYQPYSNFYVGAAIESGTKEIYTGCNVENAAYEGESHAETNALLAMNAEGDRDPRTLICVGYLEGQIPTIGLSPCGGCRQKLFEMSQISGNDLKVLIKDTKTGKLKPVSIQKLLPYAFGPKDIGINVSRYR